MKAQEIIKAIEALINLAMGMGINVQKMLDLKKNSGGNLTPEDLDRLADDAQDALDRM